MWQFAARWPVFICNLRTIRWRYLGKRSPQFYFFLHISSKKLCTEQHKNAMHSSQQNQLSCCTLQNSNKPLWINNYWPWQWIVPWSGSTANGRGWWTTQGWSADCSFCRWRIGTGSTSGWALHATRWKTNRCKMQTTQIHSINNHILLHNNNNN